MRNELLHTKKGDLSVVLLLQIVVLGLINEASTLIQTTISAMLLVMGNSLFTMVSELCAKYVANLVIRHLTVING